MGQVFFRKKMGKKHASPQHRQDGAAAPGKPGLAAASTRVLGARVSHAPDRFHGIPLAADRSAPLAQSRDRFRALALHVGLLAFLGAGR